MRVYARRVDRAIPNRYELIRQTGPSVLLCASWRAFHDHNRMRDARNPGGWDARFDRGSWWEPKGREDFNGPPGWESVVGWRNEQCRLAAGIVIMVSYARC